LRSYFDPSSSVLTPVDIVLAFTKAKPEGLVLPRRAIIVFTHGDFALLTKLLPGKVLDEWRPYRRIYRPDEKQTIIARCGVGGPNVASLVEELAAFGTTEFCLWGYCGGISTEASVGSIIIATSALREDGASYHYLPNDDASVGSEWALQWEGRAREEGLLAGPVWSTDALYRETSRKVASYGQAGIIAVEMETAAFYAVCKQKQLSAIAMLVVSDVVHGQAWKGGFDSAELKEGIRLLVRFITSHLIV
jgi:uridine phosphorylase